MPQEDLFIPTAHQIQFNVGKVCPGEHKTIEVAQRGKCQDFTVFKIPLPEICDAASSAQKAGNILQRQFKRWEVRGIYYNFLGTEDDFSESHEYYRLYIGGQPPVVMLNQPLKQTDKGDLDKDFWQKNTLVLKGDTTVHPNMNFESGSIASNVIYDLYPFQDHSWINYHESRIPFVHNFNNQFVACPDWNGKGVVCFHNYVYVCFAYYRFHKTEKVKPTDAKTLCLRLALTQRSVTADWTQFFESSSKDTIAESHNVMDIDSKTVSCSYKDDGTDDTDGVACLSNCAKKSRMIL